MIGICRSNKIVKVPVSKDVTNPLTHYFMASDGTLVNPADY